MAGGGLYLLAMAETPRPTLMMGLGHDAVLTVEHAQAASIIEQFQALQSVEARNAFGDALMLMARLFAEGAVVGLP